MLKERRESAQMVADCLFALENAIDEAVACAGNLTAAMPVARKSAKLSAIVGQEALILASEVVTFLVQARSRAIQTHESLDLTKTQIGLREFALGDVLPKPPLAGQFDRHLRIAV